MTRASLGTLLSIVACTAVASPDDASLVTPPVDDAPAAVAPAVEAPATKPEVAAEAARRPAFHVVARTGASFQLHPLVDGRLLVTAGPLVMRVDDDGELVVDLAMLRGLESIRQAFGADLGFFEGVAGWSPVGLGGRWPDALFLSLDFQSGFRGEGGQPVTYRITPNGWTKLDTRGARHEFHYAELHPWRDGAVLARRGYVPWFPGQEKWEGEDGPTAREYAAAENAIAKAKKLVVVRGAAKAPDVGSSLSAFASLPSGEIVAAAGGSSPSVTRIAADGTRRTFALPDAFSEISGVAIEAPDLAWVFGSTRRDSGENAPYLVRVDGDAAAPAEVPACKSAGFRSFVVLPGGATWATCADPRGLEAVFSDHELWTRPAGGAWARVELPDGIDTPAEVYGRAADDVWVVARTKGTDVLLHSRPAKTVAELPGLEGIGRKLHEWNGLIPLAKWCGTGYVPLTIPPGEAEAARAQLDADLKKFSSRATVSLVKTTIREELQLGLQLTFDSEATVADTNAVRKIAIARLGADAVGPARCWEATVADDGVIASWERPE